MKMSKKKKVTVRRRRVSSSGEVGGFLSILFVVLLACSMVNLNVAIMTAVGLLPTIILAVTGRGLHKSIKLQCVCLGNLAGVVTFIPKVWARPSTFMEVMMEPINYLVMLGGAALGYALIYIGPQVATYVLQAFAKEKLKTVTAQKQNLIELWGSEVLGNEEEDTATLPNGMLPRK